MAARAAALWFTAPRFAACRPSRVSLTLRLPDEARNVYTRADVRRRALSRVRFPGSARAAIPAAPASTSSVLLQESPAALPEIL
jgi:hypothetical protein